MIQITNRHGYTIELDDPAQCAACASSPYVGTLEEAASLYVFEDAATARRCEAYWLEGPGGPTVLAGPLTAEQCVRIGHNSFADCRGQAKSWDYKPSDVKQLDSALDFMASMKNS